MKLIHAICFDNHLFQVKKECPNCRVKITHHQKAGDLDNFVSRMVDMLSDEMKETRRGLIAERKRGKGLIAES